MNVSLALADLEYTRDEGTTAGEGPIRGDVVINGRVSHWPTKDYIAPKLMVPPRGKAPKPIARARKEVAAHIIKLYIHSLVLLR